MSNKESIQAMLDSCDEAFIQLDEEQKKIDNYRKVRKTDTLFQASLVKRQDELNFARGELAQRYAKLKKQLTYL
jgi:hypothetical protein